MAWSITQLGRTCEQERALTSVLGGDPQRFFLLAQRIIWGADQPDLVQVDVPRTCATLRDGYASSPAAHALAAFGLRGHDRAAADDALARGRACAPSDHPHAWLLPTDDEWAGTIPPTELLDLIPDRVWRIHHYGSVTATALARLNAATLLRLEDGSLALINPAGIDARIAAEVRALGDVRVLAVQGKAHSRGLGPAKEHFPEAETWGTQAHQKHPQAAHLRFDLMLDDGSPAEELEVVSLTGTAMEEAVLFHHPTQTLVVQDHVHANFAQRRNTWVLRLYDFGFGVCDGAGLLGYHLALTSDLRALQQGYRRIDELAPTRVVGAHFHPLEGQERDRLFDTVHWLLALRPLDHRIMLLRYFARQPTFLRDLVKYKLRQRQAASTG